MRNSIGHRSSKSICDDTRLAERGLTNVSLSPALRAVKSLRLWSQGFRFASPWATFLRLLTQASQGVALRNPGSNCDSIFAGVVISRRAS